MTWVGVGEWEILPGISWGEARDTARNLQCTGQPPQQRVICLKMSLVLRVKNPALGYSPRGRKEMNLFLR